MLLLVPTQKTNEDGGPTTNSQQSSSISPSQFSPTTATTTHSSASSNSRTISTSPGRVLVVLPSHTDLTSKLTVSESSVLTAGFLPNSLSSPFSEHHDDSREHGQLMGYSGRRRSHGSNIYGGFYSGMVRSSDPEFDTTTVTGYIDGQRQHRRHSVQAGSIAQLSASVYSPPSSSSTSTPFSSNSPLSQHLSFVDSPFTDNLSRRRHSHLGLALGGSSGSSGMDLDTVARLRHSSNSPAAASSHTNRHSRSRPLRRASTFTTPSLSSLSISSALTTSAYIPTTKSAKMVMASARHATRSFQEAFKKSMTVHSPLLTSTSSGMVLDLSPGPEPNIVNSKLRVGGGEGGGGVSSSGGVGATVDASKAGRSGVGLALSVDNKQHHHQQTSSSRKRSQDEMMKDLDRDGIVGVGVGGVNSEPMDTASDSSNSQPDSPTAHHKQQKKADSNSGRGFDATVPSNGLSALLDVETGSPPPSKKKTAVSRSQSSSSLATTSVSRPISAPSSSSASQSQSPRGSSSRSSSSSSSAFVAPSSSHSSQVPVPVKADHRMREDDEGVEKEEGDYHTLNQEREQQGHLDKVVTTQDISALTALMGALTPLEIQRRLYAHQEKQQKLRKRRLLLHQQQQQQQLLRGSAGASVSHHFPNFHPLPTATGDSSQVQTPTTQQQYRGIVGGNHIGTVDPIRRTTSATTMTTRTTVMNMTSPYQQQPYPPYLFTRHPQGHRTQSQTQGPPPVHHPSPVPTSAAATSASMPNPSHPLYHQHQYPYHPQNQQQQLPSCYYLPPSAFRTAAAVAAEEQLEAERKRRELLHLAATATTIDGEVQPKERKPDQELEKEKKMKKVVEEEEEGEEFLIFPSPTLP